MTGILSPRFLPSQNYFEVMVLKAHITFCFLNNFFPHILSVTL